MSDSTGIIASIKMTEKAKYKMYQNIGKKLATDYFSIQKAFAIQQLYDKEMAQIVAKQNSNNPLSFSEYMQATKALDNKYTIEDLGVDAGDMLFIRYNAEKQTLFYFHLFRWNDIDNLNTSISVQTFLQHIAEYKDIDSEDFIFFSDCATDLLHSQFYKIWSVTPNKLEKLELKEWNESWNEPLAEANQMANEYYFDIVAKHQMEDENGYWFIDEEKLEKELKNQFLDNELMQEQ